MVSEGVTYDVQVVTLAGHPGYFTGYVWGAPGAGLPFTGGGRRRSGGGRAPP